MQRPHRYSRGIAALVAALGLSTAAFADEFRTIDGSGNNATDTTLNTPDTPLRRDAPAAYADGVSAPRGGDPTSLPSARAISNAVSAQSGNTVNRAGASDWLWQWGQFLDHDLDLTPAGGTEPFDIVVPAGDASFIPGGTISLTRSIFDATTGTGAGNPREQKNEITGWIDASNVYGSDATRAAALRTGSGGRLVVDTTTLPGEVLLPKNTFGLDNDATNIPDPADAFVAGDVRVNEQIGLTAAHTLFVREHNRLAADLDARLAAGEAALDAKFTASGLSRDDFLYETARKVVGAQMQKITYEEFLPILLGSASPDPSAVTYDGSVDARISNEFSTAAFRVGHTMLSPTLQRIDPVTGASDPIALQSSFFDPGIVDADGVDSLLLGLAHQSAQAIDTLLVDDVRNFLFGPPGAGGFDLASLNLQRGRDHGLGSLNDVRAALGLGAYADFDDITSDTALAAALEAVYGTGNVDDVDLWIGGLAEDLLGDGLLGETFSSIIADQFERLALGDRFFYTDADILGHLALIDPDFGDTTLTGIIVRNSSVTDADLPGSAFVTIPEPTTLAALGLAVVLLHRRPDALEGRR